VIDFWATWCAPCRQQIPVLKDYAQAVQGRDIQVLGVAVDAQGREVVQPFVVQHGISYPVLLGSEKLAFDYGAQGYPALAVVDPEGRIRSLHLGVIDRATLEAAVADAQRQAP
jgi:thiol-disulfide isomerase/thioredoxin